jgi:hypothetical protein
MVTSEDGSERRTARQSKNAASTPQHRYACDSEQKRTNDETISVMVMLRPVWSSVTRRKLLGPGPNRILSSSWTREAAAACYSPEPNAASSCRLCVVRTTQSAMVDFGDAADTFDLSATELAEGPQNASDSPPGYTVDLSFGCARDEP